MASQAGIYITVISHSNFMQLRLSIDLYLSNISITMLLGQNIEGAQIDMGRNLCTTFSDNTCRYADNNQYGEINVFST